MKAAPGMRLATWLMALIGACVLPLVGLAAWLAYQSVVAQHSERERDAAARAQNVATAIDQELQARIAALQMLALSPQLDDPARWGDLYRQAQGFYASLGSHVILASADEGASAPLRMLFNTRLPLGSALPPLPRPQGRAAVPLALQTGQPAVGDLFAGPTAGEPLVAIAVPVPRAGRPSHVVLSTPEARLFQQRLDRVALPPAWALSLLDSRGEPIARRAPPGYVPAAAEGATGRHRVVLATVPWAVVLETPAPVLQAPLRQAALALAAAIAAATVLSIVGGLLAARRLCRAIDALVEVTPGAAPPPDIFELAQARRRLDDANRHRDDAVATASAAEAGLRATFELAHVGMAHVGLDGRWRQVNRRLCQIVGYTEAELLAGSFQDITHPDDLAADLDLVRQVLAGEIPAYEMDKRYCRRDGAVVWVALAVALVRTAAGAPDFFISVVEDISARKRLEQRGRAQLESLTHSEAEGRRLLALAQRSRAALLNVLQDQHLASDALRASEAYRRRLFEQVADGVLLVDVDGRIHDANPRAEAMFGCAPGELVTLRMAELLAGGEQERLADEVPRMMAGGAQLTEWEQLRRDGTHFPSEVSARPIDERRYVAVLRDISERRAAERSLLRYQVELSALTQRLLAQERVTTQRLAQALHDHLGQTLAVAQLRLGALEMRLDSATPAERAEALARLGSLLGQAVAQTRQVLAELRPPLLEDQGLAAALDNELQGPGLADGLAAPPTLVVAARALAQRWPADAEYAAFMVAREAINNALRHAQATRVHVRLDGGPQWLRLEVEDNGIGLPSALAQGRPGHLGIVGMRERALAIGAHFAVTGGPGGGTRVTLTWDRTQP